MWSDQNRTTKCIDVECALANVQAKLGLIRHEAANEFISHCELSQIDMDGLRHQTDRISYPILGVVSQITRCALTSWATAPPRTTAVHRQQRETPDTQRVA